MNLKSRSFKSAISRTVLIVVVVVIIIIIAGGAYLATLKSATSSSSVSTTSTSSTPVTLTTGTASHSSTVPFGPANASELIDDSSGAGTGAPDTLDPAGGDYGISDDMVYLNVYQQLVSFDGPNSTSGVVIPDLAQSYNVSTTSDNYTFNLRSGVTFYPSGDQMNASTVWFSFVRGNYLNTAIEDSNYLYVTENQTVISTTGMALPWGLLNAVQNATGLPVTTNYKLASTVLNQMLSNFNANNKTIQSIMSFPHQAYVVTGPMSFQANELKPYPYFLTNIAQWWGAIVDPAYVDAHGGVQNNTANTYFTLNGGTGTGPYYIASVGTGYSTVVLKANPDYWGLHVANIPTVLEPPKIPVVIINYGLTQNSRSEVFASNQAQISFVELPLLGQLWNAYNYKQYTTLNQIVDNFGTGPNTYFIPMNVDKFPTNNTDFRLAVVHAINYTQMLDESFSYNGALYGENFLGPLTPEWGKDYDPGNLSLYSYNLTLATSLINQAGKQEGFSLTLPNGTTIGDTSAPALGPIVLDYIAPNSFFEQTEEAVIISDLSQIGLAVATQGVTSAVEASWTTPAEWPVMALGLGWGPDWNDPILQELYEVITPEIYFTWMNLTSISTILSSLTFNTNQTALIQGLTQIYSIVYNYAPDIWVPNYDNYLLVQPYIQGMIYSPYTTIFGQFWYNTLYYS